MQKAKNVFGCIGITAFIWFISRFMPSIIRIANGTNTTGVLLTYVIALPIGWVLSRAISQKKYSQCIRLNLYIFAIIEAFGVFDVLSYLLQGLSFYTGRYTTDSYGVAYSDYFSVYGALLLLEVSYIALCIFLAKKTPSVIEEIPIANHSECISNVGRDISIKTDETYYYMDAANGMTVRVPESRLEVWQSEQDRIKENIETSKLTETEEQLVDAIVRNIYGPKDESNSTAEASPSTVPARNSKQRYCRLCGGAIDLKSRKCTKCGKQFFSLQLTLSKLKKPFVVALVLVLIVSNIYLTVNLLNAQRDVAVYQEEVSILTNDKLAYDERISDLTFQLDDLGNEIDNLYAQRNDMKNELDDLYVQRSASLKKIAFYDQYVVFAFCKKTNNSYDISYHKYDCPIFQELIQGSGVIGVYDANFVDVNNKLTCIYCCD